MSPPLFVIFVSFATIVIYGIVFCTVVTFAIIAFACISGHNAFFIILKALPNTIVRIICYLIMLLSEKVISQQHNLTTDLTCRNLFFFFFASL